MNVQTPRPLGKLLRRLRNEAGLTMYELAKRTGINRSTLMRIEDGSTSSPDTGTLNALAKALKVEPEQLYDAAWHEAEIPLPSAGVYFRSKYRLNSKQITELEDSIRRVTQKPNRHSGTSQAK